MAMELLNHNKKITKALNRLNRAADEKRDELLESFDHAKRVTVDAIEEQVEKIKDTAATVQKTVKKNPWAVIGGTAAGSLAIGYLLGAFRKK